MKFNKPTKLEDVDVAFPTTVSHLMPKYDDIPKEFKDHNNPFAALQAEWFFKGMKASKLIAKEYIDRNMAMRHLQSIQGSFEPKHEHKSAGVAYLMSLWFDLA